MNCWLARVRPKLAVASVAKDNEYGHPGPGTLALLARSDIPLLRTGQDGAVAVESDGKGWRVVGRQIGARGLPAEKGRSEARRESQAKPAGRPINVNTASEAELEALPGVGPVIARRIIEGRPYRSVEDLVRVKGIGRKRLEHIRPLVTVD